MRSIISIMLAAAMLAAVLTGCGRNKNDTVLPTATAAPVQATTEADRPNTADNNMSGNNMTGNNMSGTDAAGSGGTSNAGNEGAGNNAVNNMMNGVENAVNDVVDGVESIPGDLEDGRVEDEVAGVRNTPQAR